MNAGRLSYFLTPMRLETVINPDTGSVSRQWVEQKEIRAERMKFTARAVTRGAEGFFAVDAVYLVRMQHRISDGWRVRDRDGVLYDVTVEPNREKGLKLLKCVKVNE